MTNIEKETFEDISDSEIEGALKDISPDTIRKISETKYEKNKIKLKELTKLIGKGKATIEEETYFDELTKEQEELKKELGITDEQTN